MQMYHVYELRISIAIPGHIYRFRFFLKDTSCNYIGPIKQWPCIILMSVKVYFLLSHSTILKENKRQNPFMLV